MATPARGSLLDSIERLGNRLPEPPILFCWLALIVIVFSAVGTALDWSVQPLKPVAATGPDGRLTVSLLASGAPIEPRSLLTADGLYFMFSAMLRNFATMPALPLLFVSMLGIGLAEKFGFFAALMRQLALVTPRRLLTPVIVFVGANSSIASDAGYVILPPLAAALYLAMGRHPVAGLSAAFCGVAGGFGGGLFPTGGDGVLTGFAQESAHVDRSRATRSRSCTTITSRPCPPWSSPAPAGTSRTASSSRGSCAGMPTKRARVIPARCSR